MGFRFRRRVRILPGLWFNLSKSGGSISLGGRGATMNIGRRGARTTLGIPGSGWSWRSPTAPWGKHQMPPPPLMAANRAPRPPASKGHSVLLALACTIIVGIAIAAWQIITG
jgi:hypothetical protein